MDAVPMWWEVMVLVANPVACSGRAAKQPYPQAVSAKVMIAPACRRPVGAR